MIQESKKKLRKSGLVFSVIFSLVFILLPYIFKGNLNIFAINISSLILVISFIKPNLLKTPYKLWIKFGDFLSKFNSKIVLALFFYIMITPVAILRKAIKFFIKKDSNKKSFYTKIGNEYLNSKFKDQF